MDRRTALSVTLALALLVSPFTAEPQEGERVRRVGHLSGPPIRGIDVDTFRQGLRENGYVEGRNLLIEWRSAEGRDDRLRALAAELVTLNVDVIVTFSTSAALAAKKATATIPIVFRQVSDPVGSGVVPSLARPGGNITGLTHVAAEITGKRLELLKEAVPSLRSVAILTDPANPVNASVLPEMQIAARRLGLELRVAAVRHPDEFQSVLTPIAREGAAAVVLVPGPFIFTHRSQIAELAKQNRIPVLGWTRGVVEAGALISYGVSPSDLARRAAGYVARILNGAKPGDLPVEQPTRFELVINRKTAKALGLTISQSLLLRADDVIE